MQILPVDQGTPEWLEVRSRYCCASEAPIIMGASPKMSRADFLKMKANGSEREFSDYVRGLILARGHEVEGPARELVETLLGEELYPVVGVHDDLPYLASFDGATLAADRAMEHKLWSEALAAQIAAKDLDPEYYWQLEHEALVAGLDEILFVASDGTPDHFASMSYRSTPERRAQLQAGWQQFDKDLREYRHEASAPASAVVAKPEALPELMVTVVGEVRSSNLTTWRDAVVARIQAISTDLQTDDDFGRAEATVRWLDECEKRLALVRDQILSQTGSIDETLRGIAAIGEEMRTKRLNLTNKVAQRKQDVRGEIVQKAKDALKAHVDELNQRWAEAWMPDVLTDFAGAIKGKKTVKGVTDAADAELTRAKLAANQIADRIDKNLRGAVKQIREFPVLFADLRTLVVKAPEDFTAAVEKRIADHQAAERRRAEAAAATPAPSVQQAPAGEANRPSEAPRTGGAGQVPQTAGSAAPSVASSAISGSRPLTREERLAAMLMDVVQIWRRHHDGIEFERVIDQAERLILEVLA
jgi:putative phage-type endonuclease